MSVLVTGGAGYIGSHACVVFLEAGHDVVVLDNLSNASEVSLTRVAQICGRDVHFEKADIRDQSAVSSILRKHQCQSVVHFAGLKAVADSVAQPLDYYDTNVTGTLKLLAAMREQGVRKLIFSSSATVYGEPRFLPLTEDHPLGPVNPYGKTKAIVEEILRDLSASDPSWRIGILRYFNPVGAHHSGLIGEDPLGTPNNLMPLIAQVAGGRRERLSIFGNDYETVDGTGVRDYIHVVDLAVGHLRAHEVLDREDGEAACFSVNLGTGTGYSVLQMIKAFERASNKPIPYELTGRREGDVAGCFANTGKAESLLGWKADMDLQAMCHDTWNFVCKNPKGYSA